MSECMSSRPIWIALAGNVIVAATTLGLLGWNGVSAHAAARNTARFSMLWLAVGFAAPGLVRFVKALPEEARLIQAFLAAHVVHFAVVVLLLLTFEARHLAQHRLQAVLVITLGFGLALTAGLTATPRASRLYSAAHSVALYTVFLIFLVAFTTNPRWPWRLLAIPLVLALLLRVARSWRVSPALP
jgi:hypothetical protein